LKVKSLVEFSGVPKGTVGTIEKDEELWKVSWDSILVFRGIPFKKRPLQDWFNDEEKKQYLVAIK